MATVTSIKMIELIKSMDYHTASTHVKLASKSIPQHCQHDGKTCLLHDQKKSTIILDGAEGLFLELFRFVKIWKTVLGIFVGLNLYLTPPNEQGLLWHSDKTDVIIFQLEGIKQWDVCARVLPNLNRQDLGTISPLRKILKHLIENCTTVTLTPGTVLYLPAGVVHRAQSIGTTHSLHITTSISRTHHEYTWCSLLANIAFREEMYELGEWMYGVGAQKSRLTHLPLALSNVSKRSTNPNETALRTFAQFNLFLKRSIRTNVVLPTEVHNNLIDEFEMDVLPILLLWSKTKAKKITQLLKNKKMSLQFVLSNMKELLSTSFFPYSLSSTTRTATTTQKKDGVLVRERREAKKKAMGLSKSLANLKSSLVFTVCRNDHIHLSINEVERTIRTTLQEQKIKVPFKTTSTYWSCLFKILELIHVEGKSCSVSSLVEYVVSSLLSKGPNQEVKVMKVLGWMVKNELVLIVQTKNELVKEDTLKSQQTLLLHVDL